VKKTAVVTGATSGIGRALVNDLARRGFRLVLPCRDPDKALALRAEVCLHSPGAQFDFVPCDLADLASVRKCGQLIADRHPVVDLVVACAATVEPRKTLTRQGVERTLAVNHLAHFTLIHWLLGNFYVHSRVILVASSAARWARVSFVDDLDYRRRRYRMFPAYANSKLANIACASAFASQLKPRQVACISVHPGLIASAIWPTATPLQKLVVPLAKRFYFAPPSRGAEVIGHLALAAEHNESSGYFELDAQVPPPRGLSEAFQDRLEQVSLELCANYLPEWSL